VAIDHNKSYAASGCKRFMHGQPDIYYWSKGPAEKILVPAELRG